MNTIKFQAWDREMPLGVVVGDELPTYAKTISINEGRDIWHRPFEVRSLEEYANWKLKFAFGRSGQAQVPGEDPGEALAKMRKDDKIPVAGHDSVYFEYLTFYDSEGEFHKCVVFSCNCYIMNRDGQTVDSFSA